MFGSEKIRNLNELELSLYEYIMKNSEKVIYMKIRDLANELHVSTTTVLRFCRKLDCDGFTEFKLKFKMYLEEKSNSQVSEDVSFIIDNLKRIDTKEYREKIEQLCDIFRKYESIVFIGGGLSGIIGKYVSRYISSTGKFTTYIDDLFYPLNCEGYNNNLVVVLSISGETVEIIEAINKFKRNKCTIVSITNSKNSTIAKMSDFNIAFYLQEERIYGSDITSHIPIIYILETVARKLYNERIKKNDI